MTIKELEEKSGIPRANIRFYEKEGLLVPKRLENGYRTYCREDYEVLEKIIFFRKLGVSIPDIKRILNQDVPLSLIVAQNIEQLESQMRELQGALQVCQAMQKDEAIDYAFDLERYQTFVSQEEAQGRRFFEYMKDYLQFEKKPFFAMWANTFFIDIENIFSKRDLKIGCLAILLICLARGLAVRFLWKTGPFLPAFLYPLLLAMCIAVLTLPIYMMSEKYRNVDFESSEDASDRKIPFGGIWKVLGGLLLFFLIIIGVPLLLEKIYTHILGTGKSFIITGSPDILYYLSGMYLFVVVLWLYSKNGIFGNVMTGEKGMKAQLPKKQRRKVLLVALMVYAAGILVSGTWFTCITDTGIQNRRFFQSRNYPWEMAASYELSADFDGTLKFTVLMKDGRKVKILGGNSRSNLDEEKYPEGEADYILEITGHLLQAGAVLNEEHWDQMMKQLKYDYWKEYAEEIREL